MSIATDRAVLLRHAPRTEGDVLWGCRCGWRVPERAASLFEFAQHQADALNVERPVDTTGTRKGDPNPRVAGAWGYGYAMCGEVRPGSRFYGCTAPEGHLGQHVASGPVVVAAVWPA